jgi:hypothetical protein
MRTLFCSPRGATPILLALATLSSCSAQPGCATDWDCKGNRVCSAGQCVDAPAGPDLSSFDMSENPADTDRAITCAGKAVGPTYKFTTDLIKLPGAGADMGYSINIDGDKDNVIDNQLKKFAQLLRSASLDLDSLLARALIEGEGVVLVEVQAESLTEGCAKVTLRPALGARDKPKRARRLHGGPDHRLLPGQGEQPGQQGQVRRQPQGLLRRHAGEPHDLQDHA